MRPGWQGSPCGTFFYLSLILDLFSCKIVGWEVEQAETAAAAAADVERADQPARWNGASRAWTSMGSVWLTPNATQTRTPDARSPNRAE